METSLSVTTKSTSQLFLYLKKQNLSTYILFQEGTRRKDAFQTSTAKIYKSKLVITPSPSFWKEASLLHTVFYVHGLKSYQRRSSRGPPHEKLSCAVDSGGCTPNQWRHHGHKPESSWQALGRRGSCMTTHGNPGQWSMIHPKLWAHPSLPW